MLSKLIPPLLMLVFFTISTTILAQTPEQQVSNCYKQRFRDFDNNPVQAMPIYENFEKVLIEKGLLRSVSQESYVLLVANLINGDITIPLSDITTTYQSFRMLAMPSNLSASMLCYEEVYDNPVDSETSIGKMRPFVLNITENFNIGDKANNVNLVRSINISDFNKMLYKAPLLSLIYYLAQRSETSVENTDY